MKHYLIIILTTIPFILLSGCSKEDELLNNRNANNEDSTSSNTSKEENNNDTPEKEENIYYVKYEVYMKDASTGSVPYTRDIKFTSEKGEQTITTYNDSWTGIYGPFKKGAKLSLTAKGNLVANTAESYIIISVSRNNEPFSVKAEEREKGGDLLSVNYTISY